jgi:hypothetical protein
MADTTTTNLTAASALTGIELFPAVQSGSKKVTAAQLKTFAQTGLATVASTGAYADLTGKPSLATVATTGAYSDLTGSPALAAVATSGAATDLTGTLGVGHGGTGLTAGISGGVPFYSLTSALTSSALLTANAIMLGGGAGAGPAPLGSLGTTTTVLHGNAAGAPTFGAVSLTADVSGILPVANGGTGGTAALSTIATTGAISDSTGTLAVARGGTGLTAGTSGGVPFYSATSAITSSGLLTANALVLGGGAGAAPAPLGSLGTTTTVLHGNAAGAPTFGAVSLTTDVSGYLPGANGGTGGKNNTAASDPGVSNDSSQGYVAGSVWFNTSTGSIWRCYSASGGAAIWDRQDYADHPGYIVGNFILPYSAGMTPGAALVTNIARFIPWVPKQNCSLTTLGARITTVGTTNLQLAIYTSDPTTKKPTGSQLGATGNIVNTSNVFVSGAFSGAVTVSVQAGQLYWLAINNGDSACICYVPSVSGYPGWLLGSSNGGNIVAVPGLNAYTTPLTFGTWGDVTAASWTEIATTVYAMISPKIASIP